MTIVKFTIECTSRGIALEMERADHTSTGDETHDRMEKMLSIVIRKTVEDKLKVMLSDFGSVCEIDGNTSPEFMKSVVESMLRPKPKKKD